jgi:hypothetical protein
MALPLVAGLAGVAGGSLLGGALLGKKEYTTSTVYEAPYHTYSPSMVYAPQTTMAYTSGAKIFNSPFASASERIGLSPTSEPTLSSLPNSNLGSGLNPNSFIPIILVTGAVIILSNITKKR